MSDDYLRLIPVDQRYVPTSEQVTKALELVVRYWPETEPEVVAGGPVKFVDSGANLRRIRCPECGSSLDEDWWRRSMDHAYKTGFEDLSIVTPCCGNTTSLNDLEYEWPAGFARFRISLLNPARKPDAMTIQDIGEAVGCAIREVWAHY